MRCGSIPKEIKSTENQRKIDERLFDPLDLKLRLTCMIRPPVSALIYTYYSYLKYLYDKNSLALRVAIGG